MTEDEAVIATVLEMSITTIDGMKYMLLSATDIVDEKEAHIAIPLSVLPEALHTMAGMYKAYKASQN